MRFKRIVAGCLLVGCALAQPQTRVVSLDFDARLGDKPVTDLTTASIALKEDGKPVALRSVRPLTGPASIGILFDQSGSTRELMADWERVFEAFVTALPPDDEVFLMLFDVETDLVMPFSKDRAALRTAFAQKRPHGQSAIFKGVATAAAYLEANASTDDQILVVFSDGGNNQGSATLDDFVAPLEASPLQLYGISLKVRTSGDSYGSILHGLARMSGGEAWTSFRPAELRRQAGDLPALIHDRYRLEYETAAPIGKRRKISLKVDRKGVKSSTREGVRY